MKSILSRKLALSQSSAAGFFTFLICAIFNFPFIIDKFAIQNNWWIFILEIFVSLFLVFTFLFVSSFKSIIFKIVTVILMTICGFTTYSFNHFKIFIDKSTIGNLIDNSSDIGDVFILSNAILYITLFVLLPFFLLIKISIKKDKNNFSKLLIATVFMILAIILGLQNHCVRKGIIYAYPPQSILESIYGYCLEINPSLYEKQNLQPINDIIKTKFTPRVKDLKIVLIIGESARAQNFSLYGYKKDTNPQLKKVSNLLTFKDVTPCSNYTNYSVGCMLSYKDEKDFSLPMREESIIKIFEHLNFSTSWFSTQKAYGDNNSLMLLALEAQNYHFGDSFAKKIGGKMIYDEYLLDDMKQDLSRSGDSLIIMQMQGSHFLFNERYPKNFEKFTPTCNIKDLSKCNKNEIVNAYDNTILYTDNFIAKTIQQLKSQNAILIYVSDHGQFLGENDIYYHGPKGSHIRDEHRVAMFMWMSNKLLANHFYRKKYLNAKNKINKKLSHDVIFDSMLDCVGIESDYKFDSFCK